MRTGWLSLGSLAFLLACGGESTSDGAGGNAGTGGGSSGGNGGSGNVGNGGSGNGGSGAVSGSGGLGAAGGVGGGASGGAPGGGGAPCAALNQAYAETLQSAKQCNPFIDMNECTDQMPDALMCPCASTFVNPGNTQAMSTLKELQAQWNLQKCFEGIGCPAIACEQPAFGTCQPTASGETGACEDLFTNDTD
jgi:hypothetical protein